MQNYPSFPDLKLRWQLEMTCWRSQASRVTVFSSFSPSLGYTNCVRNASRINISSHLKTVSERIFRFVVNLQPVCSLSYRSTFFSYQRNKKQQRQKSVSVTTCKGASSLTQSRSARATRGQLSGAGTMSTRTPAPVGPKVDR